MAGLERSPVTQPGASNDTDTRAMWCLEKGDVLEVWRYHTLAGRIEVVSAEAAAAAKANPNRPKNIGYDDMVAVHAGFFVIFQRKRLHSPSRSGLTIKVAAGCFLKMENLSSDESWRTNLQQ